MHGRLHPSLFGGVLLRKPGGEEASQGGEGREGGREGGKEGRRDGREGGRDGGREG